MEISLTQQVLLYLLNCAIGERVPEELPTEVDFEELYKLGKYHSVTALLSYALDKGGYLKIDYMTQELLQKWVSARIGSIRKNVMFNAEREVIIKYLEQIGCWYMPLKGVILETMYPDVGIREMCDNDILFDKNYREQIRDFMVERGYTAEAFQKYITDMYLKSPFYNFEFHTELFEENFFEHWANYYEDIKRNLCKDENNRYGYHFKDEDFYIYMIAHAYKHYMGGGTGIRSFLDICVYLKNKKDIMDWEYIAKETSYIQIEKFEFEARKISQRLFQEENTFFDIQPKSEKEAEMLSYILRSGTYGTLSNKMQNEVSVVAEEGDTRFNIKLKYCIQRLFPGIDHMRKYYPFFYKYRVLIPLFWIYRLLVFPIIHSKKIWTEIKMLLKL